METWQTSYNRGSVDRQLDGSPLRNQNKKQGRPTFDPWQLQFMDRDNNARRRTQFCTTSVALQRMDAISGW